MTAAASRRQAKHSKATCEHGSPVKAVELARYALGRIDVDPCSNEYWNRHVVRATRFFDRRRNGLRQVWGTYQQPTTVWLNPAGADDEAGTESVVRPMWERLAEHWRRGALEGAVYLGYSLEQLQQLQSCPVWTPGRCIVLLPSSRFRFLRAVHGCPPVEGEHPTHANFLALLTSTRFGSLARAQVERFAERGRELGDLMRPMR